MRLPQSGRGNYQKAAKQNKARLNGEKKKYAVRAARRKGKGAEHRGGHRSLSLISQRKRSEASRVLFKLQIHLSGKPRRSKINSFSLMNEPPSELN